MKAQVEEENIHEESIQPTSEEDHATTMEATIEPCNPEPENQSLPEAAETTEEPEYIEMTMNNSRKHTWSNLKTLNHNL